MSFYETPRRNASDSTTSTRSMARGHRREHSDPCPLPSPGLPHMEIGIRWCLIVILTLFGQWVCAAASRRLAIILMRDRNLSKRDADHPLRGSRGSV